MISLATAAPRTSFSAGTATARMTRVLFSGTALTGIAFAGLAAGHTAEQADLLDPVWGWIVAISLWGLPLLIIALSWWAPLGVLHAIAVALIAVYSAAVVTWPFVQQVPRIPNGAQPWIINLLPLATFAAALVLPRVAAWGYLVLACLAAGVLRYVADGSRSIALPLQDTLFNAMYLTVFVAIILVTMRAGRQRDEAAERTAADAVAASAAAAQNRERTLVAALTHDDVIATLLAAARATDATAPLVGGHASRALERLDELSRVDVPSEGTTSTANFVQSVRSTVTAIAGDIPFSAPEERAGEHGVELPTAAARALLDATAEALRNSLRHADVAGRTVSRAVTVVSSLNRVTVEVSDDGRGFDVSSVPVQRFGIRLSIAHRMAVVPGGSALLDSTPGSGTRVTLSWSRGR